MSELRAMQVGDVYEYPDGCAWEITGMDSTQEWPVRGRLISKPPGHNTGNRVGYESWGFTENSFPAPWKLRGPTPPVSPVGPVPWAVGQRRRIKIVDLLHPREVEGVLCAKEDEPWIGGNYEFGFKGDKGEVFGVDSDWPSTLLDASPESVPQELTRNVGTFSNKLTSQLITAENMKRAMDAIEALKNKTVFISKEFRYGIDWGFTRQIYDPEFGASPMTAPSVVKPAAAQRWVDTEYGDVGRTVVMKTGKTWRTVSDEGYAYQYNDEDFSSGRLRFVSDPPEYSAPSVSTPVRPHDFSDPYAISMCDPMDGSPLVRVPVCKACGWRSDIPQTSACRDNPSWRLTMDSAVQHCTAKRSTEKREARKESPFHQSHSLLAGGIWSLRSEDGR